MAHVGRPRAFDMNKALDAALQVFWQKGYEGTSMPDLTEAMGINRPSLYAAFGNKEELFLKALDRYAAEKASFLKDALGQPTARKVAESLLMGAADALSDPCNPRGCLAVQGALSCGEEADVIRKELASRRAASETAIRDRLQCAKHEGDLPKDAHPGDLARFIATVTQGMAVQAASGATRKDLRQVAKTALKAWPSE